MELMMHKQRWLGAVLLCALSGGIGYMIARHMGMCGVISPERCKLRTAMRELWAEHVVWTRCYIISALADLPDLKDTTERLLKNQDDIGNAVAGFYGAEAGKQLAALLRDHILIAAEVVAAAKADDKKKLEDANKRWHDNAADISQFLSKANPNWPYDDMLAMMNKHLELTTQEAVARIKKDWKKDIATYDEVFKQILGMADHLTQGIAAQFPDKV